MSWLVTGHDTFMTVVQVDEGDPKLRGVRIECICGWWTDWGDNLCVSIMEATQNWFDHYLEENGRQSERLVPYTYDERH